MNQNHAEGSSAALEIQARVCPQGHVYLYVGHTCVFLRKEEFMEVAQMVRTVEDYLLTGREQTLREQSH
jgi:hypothetical protein